MKILNAVQVVSNMKQTPDVAMYLMDPTVPKQQKANALTASLKDMNVSPQTINFMGKRTS